MPIAVAAKEYSWHYAYGGIWGLAASRVPNQIPAFHPKNGSKAYKEEILKILAKEDAMTTEELQL